MPTKLYLSPSSLYPITKIDDKFQLISDTLLFANLIATQDFSRVMSKLQLLKLKKTPLNMMFSIKTRQGQLPVFMHGEYCDHGISIILYDLNRMDETEMKQYYYQGKK